MRNLVPVGVVAQFAALLGFGTGVATAAAAAAVALAFAAAPERRRSPKRLALDLVAAIAAMQAAGAVYHGVGRIVGSDWPAHAAPMLLGVLTFAAIKGSASAFVAPLLERAPVSAAWPQAMLHTVQDAVLSMAVAAAFIALVEHRQWTLIAVTMIPLYFAHRVYRAYSERADSESRGADVVESLEEGIATLDRRGAVTYWSAALERILEFSRDRALGQRLLTVLPTLAKTELPRAIEAALSAQPQTGEAQVALSHPGGTRTIRVKVSPSHDGAVLLWEDVTGHQREQQVAKRQQERLALAAAGSNDGLWEWDLATQEFYASGRWKAMLGLDGEPLLGRPDEWLGRVHPEDVAALKEALDTHLAGKTEHLRHEHRILHEDGTYRWFLCHAVASRSASRRSVRIGGSLTDTTERTQVQERLRSAGFLDSLTGLCNRAVFVEGIGRRLAESKQRRTGGRFALLYLDLDRFKIVNDSLGHLVGDELLIAVSRRLESCVRAGDSLARLGGDEFAILVNSLAEDQQANAMAFRIQEALRAPFSIGGREVFTSASIGIAFGPAQYADPDEIMRDADTAMYHAKSRGKARHEIFDADMHARVRDRLGLENDLRHAVRNNNFEVHYQPIVSLATGMCVGFESLVRWSRNGEAISPATFIPMAEELGLIEPIGTWVLQQACHTFADWQRRFPDGGLECITVNVSSRQLMQHNFLRIVERAVHDAQLNPSDLRIEITETALMDSPAVVAESLRELRDFGVKIYLDDFGTGYSSLSHLHKLPVDALKIDRSFVRSLLLPDRPAIVESVLALARTLNTSVVAEGIESDRQAFELERLGCTHAQGFLFSRPLSQQSTEALIVAHQPLGPKRTPPDVVASDADLLLPSAQFEWPSHVSVR